MKTNYLRKALSAMMVLLLLLISIPNFTFASTTVHIKNSNDLSKIYAGTTKTYELDCDIELSATFKPISNFKGTFNGNHYKITNLDSVAFANNSVRCIFSENYGTITNLNVNVGNLNIYDSNYAYLGVICNKNRGTISSCSSFGNVTVKGINLNTSLGGIAKDNFGTIDDCINNINFDIDINQSTEIGGITCVNQGKITNCINNGNITANSEDTGSLSQIWVYAGGISAEATTLNNNVEFTNCYNSGKIDIHSRGNKVKIGGIVGIIQNENSDKTITLDKLFNKGKIIYEFYNFYNNTEYNNNNSVGEISADVDASANISSLYCIKNNNKTNDEKNPKDLEIIGKVSTVIANQTEADEVINSFKNEITNSSKSITEDEISTIKEIVTILKKEENLNKIVGFYVLQKNENDFYELNNLTFKVNAINGDGSINTKDNYNVEIEDNKLGQCTAKYSYNDVETTYTFYTYVPGDLNQSGKSTITDAVLLKNYVINPQESNLTDLQKKSADYDKNSEVNVTDVVGIIDNILDNN